MNNFKGYSSKNVMVFEEKFAYLKIFFRIGPDVNKVYKH